MISHELKCIFIHIPKCAGTSIERALGHHDEFAGLGMQDHRSIRMIQNPFLASGFQFSAENADAMVFRLKTPLRRVKARMRRHINPRNLETLSREQYSDYFKFTFVRNPWARVYSWYRNVSRDEWMLRVYGLERRIPFEDFVRRFAGKRHLRPQTYWLEDTSGRVNLDFIGKFERLAQDFGVVSEALGLDAVSLPHVLRTKERADLGEVYDQETMELVRTTYRKEIEMFDYSFPAE